MLESQNFLSSISENDLKSIKLKVKNNKLNININDPIFSYLTLIKLLSKINKFIESYSLDNNISITIIINSLEFNDLSVYMLLESSLYYLCKNTRFKKIKIKNRNKEIRAFLAGDLKNSIVFKNSNIFINRETYINLFEKLEINRNLFRKIIKYDKNNKESLSILYSELNYFFKIFNIRDEFKESFIETIVELVSNANEHAMTDCLIITKVDSVAKKDNDNKYYKIFVSIIDFSPTLLGSGLEKHYKENIKNLVFFKDLENAYNNHCKYFNPFYTEEEFFAVSAFQWRFSGRNNTVRDNGGTGLTTLIRFLIETSEADSCYTLSGSSFIKFDNKYLHENQYNHVGFNDQKDYLNFPPNKNCVFRLPFRLEGTLYNFDFIVREEE